MRRSIVCFVSLLAACSKSMGESPPTSRSVQEGETIVMAVSGDDEALKGFEAALRRCGVTSFNRNSHGQKTWVEVRGTTEGMFADAGPLPCSMNWVLHNPKGLGFIGNEAYTR